MIKEHLERSKIQEEIRGRCDSWIKEHEIFIKYDKLGTAIYRRGFIKGMFMWLNETYTSGLIVKDYVGEDLWRICCVGEVVIELCEKYDVINNHLMFSIATGVSMYVIDKILACGDIDVLQRMNMEYLQDYKEYFKRCYKTDQDLQRPISLRNVEDTYPIYCLLKTIRDFEKDDRSERGKLGDITVLNAPEEKGGFGFAHSTTINVDNRQLILGDESKLLSTYTSVKKEIGVDLFGESSEEKVSDSSKQGV